MQPPRPNLIYGDHNYALLLKTMTTEDGGPQVRPRRTVYGSKEAEDHSLHPLLDYPDRIVRQDDFKEVIQACHDEKLFPMYHQADANWAADGWNQSQFGYCWAYGLSAAVMDTMAVEGQEVERLSPFSMGWMVGWKNRGHYLDATIKGAAERGIARRYYVPEYNLTPSTFREGWEEDALNYRPTEWWDTKRESPLSMAEQTVTILSTGRAGYVAYMWWLHALELVGVLWDESGRFLYNLIWVLRNSHAEPDFIHMSGERGIPDELYGVRSTSFPKAA